VPHSFCLADSSDGRALVAQAGDGAKLPIIVFPDGMVLTDPSNAEIAKAAGLTSEPGSDGFRRGHRRRGPRVTDLRREHDGLVVTLSDGGRVRAHAVLLATGAATSMPGVFAAGDPGAVLGRISRPFRGLHP
jgi:hypothetical protein